MAFNIGDLGNYFKNDGIDQFTVGTSQKIHGAIGAVINSTGNAVNGIATSVLFGMGQMESGAVPPVLVNRAVVPEPTWQINEGCEFPGWQAELEADPDLSLSDFGWSLLAMFIKDENS